jgi:ArsR family transcriptional regulator, cadmium/lead-responsive transcriptional repressor
MAGLAVRAGPVFVGTVDEREWRLADEHRSWLCGTGAGGLPFLAGARYHRLMAMISPGAELERTELGPAAALFRSLGDPARLVIVRRLAAGPARVTDLTAVVGLAQSTVSKHLACLRDCGLVTSEPAGRASVFRLAQPALADMLAAAEAVLAATGSAVALCPAYGLDSCGLEER